MKAYDIAVIGCGIHGAGVAQAAAAAGYSVLVLEKNPAAGLETSSRSSKLVHGGLRYLERGDFRLVKECLDERRRLLKNAPELVSLVPFYIPVYPSAQRKPWRILLGLCLYSLFSRVGFRVVPRREWGLLDGLRTEGLRAVFLYYDAQTDDTLLTQAVIRSAQSLGAEFVVDAAFSGATWVGESFQLSYRHGGETLACHARVIINAAGPWANQVSGRIAPQPEMPAIDYIQGTHIVVPGKLQHGMYYVEAPQDQRAVFVMPWHGNTLVGTTETPYSGDPAAARPLETEIAYLLAVYNHYFQAHYAPEHVLSAFAGIRVFPQSTLRAFSRSRDVMFAFDNPGHPHVVAIYGGKLTSHRATAQRVIGLVMPSLPVRGKRADTRTLALSSLGGA